MTTIDPIEEADSVDLHSARRAVHRRLGGRIPRRRRRDVARRAIDVLVAAPLMVALAPVFAAVAVAIALEDGRPVLFRQWRTGAGGRRFQMLKFRSMCHDAEARRAELQAHSIVAWPAFKMENDPRVTRVGRAIRKYNLDELPQLVNVLRGDMSLVGPRPTSAEPTAYELWQTARLETKPGITGRWQVSDAADDREFDERVRLDIGYVHERSLREDVRIMVRTLTKALRRSRHV